jgi:hypothetical protein
MKVCKECLAEAGELSVLNNATPYPHHRASHDETMHVIGQKNEWMNKSTQFSKIANKCLLALMARYVDSRINLYGGELEEDKIAEEILDLMSNPATARQIGVEPKKFEKFFETYKKQHIKLSAPDMISKWYQAVIRFGFLNILYDCPPNVVQQEIAEYLKQEIGTLYSGKLILSDLAKTTMPVSVQRAVEYLVKLLLKTGKLDSLDVEN